MGKIVTDYRKGRWLILSRDDIRHVARRKKLCESQRAANANVKGLGA